MAVYLSSVSFFIFNVDYSFFCDIYTGDKNHEISIVSKIFIFLNLI